MSVPLAASGDGVSVHERRNRVLLRGLYPALLLLAAMTLLPAVYLLVSSLTPLTPTQPGSALDFSNPAGNYVQALTDPQFLGSVWTQAKLSAGTVLLQLVLGLGLALLINTDGRLMEFVRSALIVPMILPPIVVGIIWKIMYVPETSPLEHLLVAFGMRLGSPITNPDWALTAIVVAESWEWFPFTLIMCVAALQTVPKEQLEAVRIDGANRLQAFRFVVLPWISRTLVVVAMFRLIDSVKAFPLIYVLTQGGPGSLTEVTNYYAFVQAFNFSYWGYASAIATLLVAGVMLFSWLIQNVGERSQGNMR